ncbi:hypothetical protein BD410DRAFT_402982 [Rickenella mellea]|uniref:Uncharacterized protein n=1 Tax=Rickenella mellea TaxID=50990 RepID=A0A4Y7PX54_9AGAM|nr:hypothetical protein BD410DRAFT_402982 [Rickenella mellea]
MKRDGRFCVKLVNGKGNAPTVTVGTEVMMHDPGNVLLETDLSTQCPLKIFQLSLQTNIVVIINPPRCDVFESMTVPSYGAGNFVLAFLPSFPPASMCITLPWILFYAQMAMSIPWFQACNGVNFVFISRR